MNSFINEKEIKQWIEELEKENTVILSYSWKYTFNQGKIEALKTLLEDFEK